MTIGAPIMPKEIEDYRRVYPTGGIEAVQALYPHRTTATIMTKCCLNGMRCNGRKSRKDAALYTQAEDARLPRFDGTAPAVDLLWMFPGLGPSRMMLLLPDRSYDSIVARADKFGLRKRMAPVLRRRYVEEIRGQEARP